MLKFAPFFVLLASFTVGNLGNSIHPNHQASILNEKDRQDASTIIDYLIQGPGKSQTYNWLTKLCDTFGNRFVASNRYDDAVAYLQQQLSEINVDNVWTEEAPGIPNWQRGSDDHAVLLTPREYKFPVLALGNSTAANIISAPVVVVKTFDELANLSDSVVAGSIVVYNQDYVSYEVTVEYRAIGATKAAQKGAIATLIRSVTPQSLYTLHTGGIHYDEDPKLQIPVASVTVEDAELLWRLYNTPGYELTMSLQIQTTFSGYISKPNVIAEIRGTTKPDEMIVFGGHLDSWDVGQGAMDDGGGVAITFQTLATLKALNFRPQRTVRAVFWAAEEFGYIGSAAYYAAHKQDAPKISLVMESDSGTFTPQGFHFAGNAQAYQMLNQVMTLLAPINASMLANDGQEPGDPGPFVDNDGVPGVELMTANERYFWYHHTDADTMTLHNSTDLDKCAATFATVIYTVANLPTLLPHGH